LRQWVFTPTLLNDVPVPVVMTVTSIFHAAGSVRRLEGRFPRVSASRATRRRVDPLTRAENDRQPSSPILQREIDGDGHDDRTGTSLSSVGVNTHCRTASTAA